MKSFATKCLIAAASLVVVAGSASAEVLKAEIPFSFRVGTAMMAPGTYQVFTGSNGVSAQVIRLYSHEMKSNALIMVPFRQNAAKEWIESRVPKLAFDCLDSRCELASIWDGSDRTALVLRVRGHGKHETAGLTVVTVNAIKAE